MSPQTAAESAASSSVARPADAASVFIRSKLRSLRACAVVGVFAAGKRRIVPPPAARSAVVSNFIWREEAVVNTRRCQVARRSQQGKHRCSFDPVTVQPIGRNELAIGTSAALFTETNKLGVGWNSVSG
ncbi:hypothetical protein EVAR_32372_1 [Eumeta japonica]|uniref:Uncharacterized protein n=1 Tax=Eumeta variegata TaxID=151549 RepID=A0A4C1VIR3_EUMVA|nr:hypothetical protein EVAR_32372_1 [Eumeta japonica]